MEPPNRFPTVPFLDSRTEVGVITPRSDKKAWSREEILIREYLIGISFFRVHSEGLCSCQIRGKTAQGVT